MPFGRLHRKGAAVELLDGAAHALALRLLRRHLPGSRGGQGRDRNAQSCRLHFVSSLECSDFSMLVSRGGNAGGPARIPSATSSILPRMAKPIRIVGLKRTTPIGRAAARVLRAVLLDLLEKLPDGRRDDPSKRGIHDLRVAVKRFREAFRLFRPALRKKTFRKHREWIEDLNDALGEGGDRDVALSRLRKLADGPAQPNASLAELIARLETERLGAIEALSALIARLQLEGLTAQLAATIETIEPQGKS